MKIAIVDDEKHMIDDIVLRIMEYYNNELNNIDIKKFLSGNDFLAYYNSVGKADIVFMDIEIGDSNGLELISKLRSIDQHVFVIFVTSYTQYSFNAFELDALQYLTKPVDEKKFISTFERAIKRIKSKDKYIVLKTKDRKIKINIDDIIYIETVNGKIQYVTQNNSYTMTARKTINKICNEMREFGFARCYQSLIINYKKVLFLSANEVTLMNNEKMPLSEKYKKSFTEGYSKCVWERKSCLI